MDQPELNQIRAAIENVGETLVLLVSEPNCEPQFLARRIRVEITNLEELAFRLESRVEIPKLQEFVSGWERTE